MVKETLKDHKNILENRKRTYEALSKTGRWVSYFGLLLMFGGLILIGLIVSIWGTPTHTLGYGYFLSIIGGTFMMLLGSLINKLKGIPKNYFSPDEEIFLKIFDALTFLEPYMKEKIEPAKYQCLKKLNVAHGLIKYYWDPTNIGVVMKEVGNEIEVFKERFDRYLIFTLEQGKETKEIYEILTEFGEYLIDPSKEKLVNLNKEMQHYLQFSEKARARYPIIDLLKRYQIHKHVIFVALFFAVAFIPAVFGIYYSGISMDTAYTLFAAFFAPLITGYIIYLLKRK